MESILSNQNAAVFRGTKERLLAETGQEDGANELSVDDVRRGVIISFTMLTVHPLTDSAVEFYKMGVKPIEVRYGPLSRERIGDGSFGFILGTTHVGSAGEVCPLTYHNVHLLSYHRRRTSRSK